MTTTAEHLPEITTACPPWCTLKPGHEYDSILDDGRFSRGHGGPAFGLFLAGGSDEFSDATGVQLHEVELYCESVNLSPHELRLLAANVTAAAEWLEARQAEVQS